MLAPVPAQSYRHRVKGGRRAETGVGRGAPAGAAGQTTWDTEQSSHPLTQTQEHTEPHMAAWGAQRPAHGHLSGPTAPWFGSGLGLQRPAQPREALVGPLPHRPVQRCQAGGQGWQNPGRPPGRIRHSAGSRTPGNLINASLLIKSQTMSPGPKLFSSNYQRGADGPCLKISNTGV